MLSVKTNFKFVSVFILIVSLALTGCSSLPWSDDKDDDDLFFEEDFGSEFESELKDTPSANKEEEDEFFRDDKELVQSKSGAKAQPVPVSPDEEDFFFEDDEKLTQSTPKAEPEPRVTPSVSSKEEDDFFRDDKVLAQSKPKMEPKPRAAPSISSEEEDFFFEDEPMTRAVLKPTAKLKPQQAEKIKQGTGVISSKKGGGFVSVDQKTDREELKVDVATLHTQQEQLLFRVQELQKIVNNLEPRLTATQERVDASLSAGSGSHTVNEEIRFLKSEVTRLKSEIATIKRTPASSKQAKLIRKVRPMKRYPKISRAPKKYNEALAAYKAGKYDKSILLFQEMSLSNPPQNLRDNIVFWMGSNYLKLNMYEDAIKQYRAVLTQYPDGNKVHDARYMLGVSYQKKGDTGRALDALEMALKSNPPSEVRQKIEKQLMEIK